LWPALSPAVGALSAASPGKPVHVTGHSKGGAVADLAAMYVRNLLPATVPVMVTTFAAAKPGDANFAQAYDQIITHSVRYEFQDDVVPHIPPSDQFFTMFASVPSLAPTVQHLNHGYSPVGDLIFIDWNRTLVSDSPVLRFQRYAHLAELVVTFGYPTIIADHSIDAGSGYDSGVV